jgi:hypothetical protein
MKRGKSQLIIAKNDSEISPLRDIDRGAPPALRNARLMGRLI